MKTLLKNAALLTMDDRVPDCTRGWLTVENGRIAALGPGPEPSDADEIIDCRGGLLLPGFVNTHCHAAMVPFRTLGDDCPDRLKRFLFGKCDHIFAISNREMDVFRRYNPRVSFSPVPVETSEYEVEIDRAAFRKRYGIAEDAMVFLVLGRVSRIKGQDIAVKAFIEAASKMPGSVLAIVGRSDYEPEYLDGIKTAIRDAGLEDRVVFTGMIPRADVIGFLKTSDVMLAPVRFMNSGAVIVEAWAAGTPVIQSDAVDPDLIDQGVNGWRFRSEQSGELAERMAESYENRARLPEMGCKGREKVLAEFTYPRLISIYEETIAGL